jgi:hypothetical protein
VCTIIFYVGLGQATLFYNSFLYVFMIVQYESSTILDAPVKSIIYLQFLLIHQLLCVSLQVEIEWWPGIQMSSSNLVISLSVV